MAEYRSIDNATEKIFESALQKVIGQFEVKRRDESVGVKLLARFEELRKYRSVFVHKVTELKGRSGSFMVLLIEKHLTIIEQKRHVRIEREIEEVEPILIFSIPQDIGKVYIRKETFADKVLDLITKVDIDFPDFPGFSSNYWVAGESPDLVKKHFPTGLIESLEKVKDMTIEIDGNWGLLRPDKNLTENLLLLLFSIGYKLTK